jgi:hypothetical protein
MDENKKKSFQIWSIFLVPKIRPCGQHPCERCDLIGRGGLPISADLHYKKPFENAKG